MPSTAKSVALPDSAKSPVNALAPDLPLLAVCLLAGIPMMYLAANQFVEYDGFWHVFIAQQDNWHAFWWEYMHNDHPLLFYLLLKALVKVGRSVLVYRSISVLSGLGSVYMLGRIARKLSSSAAIPVLTAMAFGLSMPTVEIAISVRSYMLSIFLVLVSFYYFLDLLPVHGAPAARRTRVLFALTAILAVCTHYFAFFYIGACALLLFAFCLLQRPLPRSTWLAYALTLLPIVLVMAALYRFHIRYISDNLNHVNDYLLQPGEPRIKFLARNFQNLFNFFAPWHIASRAAFEKVAAVLAAAVIGITSFVRSRAVVPALMLLAIVGELALAGCLDRYPFGGLMRQQFIIFPFVILTAAICLDRLLTALRPPALAWSCAALVGIAVIAVSASRLNAFPKYFDQLFAREMRLFDAAMPAPAAVYTDQFNLIAFFTFHNQWNWHFERTLPIDDGVDQYRLTRGARHMELLRDKTRWNIEFSDPTFFHDLADTLRSTRLDTVAVFCVHQVPGARTPDQEDAFQQKAFALAEAEHLQIRKFIPDGLNIYAEFAPAAPPAATSR